MNWQDSKSLDEEENPSWLEAYPQEEFHAAKAVNDPEVASGAWEEWVWQMAASKQEAIRQHFTKMDEWHQNPDKEVY